MRLRILSTPRAGAGSVYDYFVPAYDMPVYPLEIGYVNNNILLTSYQGNIFMYPRYTSKKLVMNFNYVSPDTIRHFNMIMGSLYGYTHYIQVIALGTLVNAGSSWSWLESNGQIFGTGFMYYTELPKLIDIDLYSCTVEFIEKGNKQIL